MGQEDVGFSFFVRASLVNVGLASRASYCAMKRSEINL